jgi:hypothetical protein
VYDKVRVEDVDTNQEEHIYDAIRYLCMSRPWTPRMVKSEIETAEEEYKRMMDYHRKQHDDISAAWGEETSWMGR